LQNLNSLSNIKLMEKNKLVNNRYVGTWMPVDLVKLIDETRGDISRNLYIKRAVIKALKEQYHVIDDIKSK
jgi:hypothetical protein